MGMLPSIIGHDPDLGRIFTPPALLRLISLPNRPVRRAFGEVGIFVAKQQRAKIIDTVERNGVLIPIIGGYETIWASVTHNERVNKGADQQALQVFGAGARPASPSATVYFNVIAVANATLTKDKADLSLGSTSANVTTNEFTASGLSRATATTPVGGDYTAPSTLGGTFSQIVKKTFTASGSVTAYGAGIFDSTTVSGSNLYVEDNFSSTAVLVSSDTLAVTVTITN